MNDPVYRPHVTVAAIVECEARFLFVEERIDGEIVLNQPAGHLEENEGLLDAVVRETVEETGLAFTPHALTGIYQWRPRAGGPGFLRFCFAGECVPDPAARPLDPDILRSVWRRRAELAGGVKLRSPLVLRGIDDYLAGRRYPLEVLSTVGIADGSA